MERSVEEGDIVEITVGEEINTLIIRAIRPEGIYISRGDHVYSLLRPIQDGEWKVYMFNQPHTVKFLTGHELPEEFEYLPRVGDPAKVVSRGRIEDFVVVESRPQGIVISNGTESLEVRKEGERWITSNDREAQFHLDETALRGFIRTPDNYPVSSEGMSEDQILASPFVGLFHTTDLYGLRNIINNGNLDHRLSLSRKGIPVGKGIAGPYSGDPTIEISAREQGQFPGIYTFPLTQYEMIAGGVFNALGLLPFVVVLSTKILMQKNWHYNVVSNYGVITNMTFGPNTLGLYLPEMDHLWQPIKIPYTGHEHELVIHDAIPFDFVRMILVKNKDYRDLVQRMLYVSGVNIPVRILDRAVAEELTVSPSMKIDQSRLSTQGPQYCYTGRAGSSELVVVNDLNPYTFEDYDSTEEDIDYMWQQKMENCGLEYSSDEPVDDRVRRIEDRMQELYFEDAPRTPVHGDNYPPFRYTPEYYSSFLGE